MLTERERIERQITVWRELARVIGANDHSDDEYIDSGAIDAQIAIRELVSDAEERLKGL